MGAFCIFNDWTSVTLIFNEQFFRYDSNWSISKVITWIIASWHSFFGSSLFVVCYLLMWMWMWMCLCASVCLCVFGGSKLKFKFCNFNNQINCWQFQGKIIAQNENYILQFSIVEWWLFVGCAQPDGWVGECLSLCQAISREDLNAAI